MERICIDEAGNGCRFDFGTGVARVGGKTMTANELFRSGKYPVDIETEVLKKCDVTKAEDLLKADADATGTKVHTISLLGGDMYIVIVESVEKTFFCFADCYGMMHNDDNITIQRKNGFTTAQTLHFIMERHHGIFDRFGDDCCEAVNAADVLFSYTNGIGIRRDNDLSRFRMHYKHALRQFGVREVYKKYGKISVPYQMIYLDNGNVLIANDMGCWDETSRIKADKFLMPFKCMSVKYAHLFEEYDFNDDDKEIILTLRDLENPKKSDITEIISEHLASPE